LINKLITKLRKKGAKKIYVKTDSKDQYAPTRRFYNKCGFKLQAVLPGYYDDNDNCCIYALDLTEKDALGLFPDEYVAAKSAGVKSRHFFVDLE
jgi:ribosomal protein S18 acetylase RimI-like enzyme